MTIDEFYKDKKQYYKEFYNTQPWERTPKQKKKRPKVTKANSCTKCVYFTDAGDKTYCGYFKRYKRGRRGCEHREVVNETTPISAKNSAE